MSVPEVLSALTTPFAPNGDVSVDAFRRNLHRLVDLVDGVFVAGTTGEFLALTAKEHALLVESCLDTFGPDRTVVHVGSHSTAQSIRLTRTAKNLGAERFAALTPYYLAASTQGILRHWAAIKEACDGELYGYVFPDVALTDLPPEELPEVLKSGISGIKVSATASTRVKEYLDHAPQGFKLWSGNDADIPGVMAVGGYGSVSGVSGACPRPWNALRDAMANGDEQAVSRAQQTITGIVPVLGPSIANLKHALDLQGLNGGTCRMTIDGPDQSTQKKIAAVVDLANKYPPQGVSHEA